LQREYKKELNCVMIMWETSPDKINVIMRNEAVSELRNNVNTKGRIIDRLIHRSILWLQVGLLFGVKPLF
jgi:hypothetical protein